MVKSGDVYTIWNMHGKKWHTWLFLRPCTDADIEHYDTWGYKAKGPDHEYWHYLDFETGASHITVDNVITGRWKLL